MESASVQFTCHSCHSTLAVPPLQPGAVLEGPCPKCGAHLKFSAPTPAIGVPIVSTTPPATDSTTAPAKPAKPAEPRPAPSPALSAPTATTQVSPASVPTVPATAAASVPQPSTPPAPTPAAPPVVNQAALDLASQLYPSARKASTKKTKSPARPKESTKPLKERLAGGGGSKPRFADAVFIGVIAVLTLALGWVAWSKFKPSQAASPSPVTAPAVAG